MPRFRLGAATLLVATVALACPSDGGRVDGPTSASPPVSPVPPRGTIAVGVLGEPATLDPYSPLASDLTYWLARPIYPSLYRFTGDDAIVPDLAGDLETSPGGALVTLRRARWSDGTRITAGDVVASIRRARPPSGFARIRSARARGRDVVELRGNLVGWTGALATRAFVLPGGRWRANGPTAGSFRVAGRVPGLRLAYEADRSFVPQPALRRVDITFTHSLEMMLGLLERERLDAAILPMSVNLDDRLDELGLEHAEGEFTETIYLDLDGAAPDRRFRERIVAAVDADALYEGFIRDDGRVVAPRVSDGAGPDLHVQFATAVGDELLMLMQRAMQLQFKRARITAELVTLDPKTFYGSWARDDPSEIALRRSSPGPSGRARFDAVPLFRVETVIAWLPGLTGPAPTASPDGPLWNLEAWSLSG
ncbi:MAG: ABC transporter substrate-binding protein [Actinomycetota bacterium]